MSETAAPACPEDVIAHRLAAQYFMLKREAAALKNRMDLVRGDLAGIIYKHGERDDRGSVYLPLKDAIENGDKSITSLKMERRVSSRVNEQIAEDILKEKGLWGEAAQVITVINPEAIFALYAEDKLTDDELDKILEQSESFALKDVAA
ncbi:hypothetical protein [Actinomadura atramentaria]|uniref:hypothetical protein n=1 Tax=Actinomadura atramentaria TaxID=1990 RepID=UPI0003653A4E|nr:hypothetical protein [Actinomadura atramentaria]